MQLTLPQVAKLFSVSESTVTLWVRQKNLPAQEVNSQYRFNRSELLEWAATNNKPFSPTVFRAINGDHVAEISLADALERGGVSLRVVGSDRYEVFREVVGGLSVPETFDREVLLDLRQPFWPRTRTARRRGVRPGRRHECRIEETHRGGVRDSASPVRISPRPTECPATASRDDGMSLEPVVERPADGSSSSIKILSVTSRRWMTQPSCWPFSSLNACASPRRCSTAPFRCTARSWSTLKDGNERFRTNHRLDRDLTRLRSSERSREHPMAVIFSGINPRTPAEMVFDLGLGDVFSIRTAGSVAGPVVLGSMEYACVVGGAKLIVIMGHAGSGVVQCSVEQACSEDHNGKLVGCEHLASILGEVQKSVEVSARGPLQNRTPKERAALIEATARRNVLRSVQVVQQSQVLGRLVAEQRLAVVGALLDNATGEVEFLSETAIGATLEAGKSA